MLHLLDESLEAFLRAAVPLPKREIDVSFDAPDRDWGARVSRPTINLYLWDVRPNLEQRDSGMEVVTGPDYPHASWGTVPRRDGSWECFFEIPGPGGAQRLHAFGKDEVDALEKMLEILQRENVRKPSEGPS